MADSPHPKDVRPCKGPTCTEEIFFAVSKVKRRPVPLNAKPEKRYVLTWESDPSDQILGGRWVAELVDVYVPHHSTCSDVQRFRK